jgi:type I restriction-modification system DNA methylase subunit
MPIRKSDLYSSIWASCDELRGGMDASQYKEYVLFMLFIKYLATSDKTSARADCRDHFASGHCRKSSRTLGDVGQDHDRD